MKYLASLLLLFSVLYTNAGALEQLPNLSIAAKGPIKEEPIPRQIQKWLDEKTAYKKKKTNQNGFFKKDSIRVVGYIKGYPKNPSFSSGIIYYSNVIIREDLPTTVRIYEDGRFEGSLLGSHAISSKINFNDQWIDFYAEPGTTTGLILDWNEFAIAEKSNESYDFKDVKYLGAHKIINEELSSVRIVRPNYRVLEESRKTQKPDDFKIAQLKNWENASKSADSVMLLKKTPAEIKKMIKNQIDLMYAVYLFDYPMSRDYYQKKDPDNKILQLPISDDYYDFVNKIDLNSSSLLIADDFSTFINRYEFSPLFDKSVLFNGRNNSGYLKLDSVYLKKNKEFTLAYDIAKVRSLVSLLGFGQYKDATFAKEFNNLSGTLREPFVVAEMNRAYEKYKVGKVAYELPNTAAANVFKKLISPLKGKILLVDFWAQWCGPCRSGIEGSLELRTKYKNSPDFDFVYVTDSKSTEASFYEDYTKKNLMTNTHNISPDDYLALRELFKFNGIPRYVLVDADGKILDDNFQSYNLQSEFSKLFPEKFTDNYWKL